MWEQINTTKKTPVVEGWKYDLQSLQKNHTSKGGGF